MCILLHSQCLTRFRTLSLSDEEKPDKLDGYYKYIDLDYVDVHLDNK